ncbi:hypothetical protein M527_00730, partial [Sphingobium indicum IP26]
PAAPATQAPVPPSEAGIDPALLWALGGGSLLMVGLGGAALLRRRRRREGQWEGQEHWEGEVIQPMESAATTAPDMPPMTPPPPAAVSSEEERTLEAMVAAPPSADNPFRTHAKRMTRAKFLLAQRQRQAETPMVEETAAAPAESSRPAPAATQTVYRFGSDRRRDGVFKPRTS